jgi:nucleoside-diphosphate-sugar epimerase
MADQFVRWKSGMAIVSLRFSNVFAADDYASLAAIHANPAARRANMWGYVDAADAGEACRLAVEAELEVHHRLIIAASDTISDRPSAELMASHYRGVRLKRPIERNESLLSSARTAEVIGYRPRVSWRDH